MPASRGLAIEHDYTQTLPPTELNWVFIPIKAAGLNRAEPRDRTGEKVRYTLSLFLLPV